MLQRAKCLTHFNRDGIRDPEITRGRFYYVKDTNLHTTGINDQPFVTIKGNSGVDVERPASSFVIFGGIKCIIP
jgi:hypothetical protein